jgi:hypothetical protein
MENDAAEEQPSSKEIETVKTKKPSATLPLLITLIGIFCYLGVVLPSVFEASNGLFNYSGFDIILMMGGAALVGLGAYFWFKARAKVHAPQEKSIEPA